MKEGKRRYDSESVSERESCKLKERESRSKDSVSESRKERKIERARKTM